MKVATSRKGFSKVSSERAAVRTASSLGISTGNRAANSITDSGYRRLPDRMLYLLIRPNPCWMMYTILFLAHEITSFFALEIDRFSRIPFCLILQYIWFRLFFVQSLCFCETLPRPKP